MNNYTEACKASHLRVNQFAKGKAINSDATLAASKCNSGCTSRSYGSIKCAQSSAWRQKVGRIN